METKTASSNEIRNNWRRTLDSVAFTENDIVITRYGKPVVVMISYEYYKSLKAKYLKFIKSLS